MKVWIVTIGQYSDYSFKGVFSSKDKALEFASECAMGDCVYQEADVMECILDNPGKVIFETVKSHT